MRCPCQGCTDRHEACHGSCPRYGEWKEFKAREKAAREDERQIIGAVAGGAKSRQTQWFHSMKKLGKSKIRN